MRGVWFSRRGFTWRVFYEDGSHRDVTYRGVSYGGVSYRYVSYGYVSYGDVSHRDRGGTEGLLRRGWLIFFGQDVGDILGGFGVLFLSDRRGVFGAIAEWFFERARRVFWRDRGGDG